MSSWLAPTEQELKANEAVWAKEFEGRFLDVRPYFDIQANELPEHHYWGKEQNPAVKPKFMTPMQAQYHTDMTNIPRFHPNGHAKIPLQLYDHYVPLDETGRFDWRANERKNHPKPFLHKDQFGSLLKRFHNEPALGGFGRLKRGTQWLGDARNLPLNAGRQVRLTGQMHRWKGWQLSASEKTWRFWLAGTNKVIHLPLLKMGLLVVFVTAGLSNKYRMDSWISQPEHAMLRRYRDRGSFHELLL